MRFMYRHVQQTCVIPTHIGSRKARFRRAFQLSRTPFARVRSCKLSRIRCFRVCVVGGRRSSFPKPAHLHTTGSNPSGVPRRVPSRTRALHTIGYLSSTLPLNRLWWSFTDIPEPLSLSLFQAKHTRVWPWEERDEFLFESSDLFLNLCFGSKGASVHWPLPSSSLGDIKELRDECLIQKQVML